jgi:hypothetical protein
MLARLNQGYSLFPSAWPSGIGILILWSEPALGTAFIAGSITPAPTLPSFALASPNPQPTSPPAIPKPTTLATAAVPTPQKSRDALPSPADPPALSVTVTNSPSTNQHPNSPYGSSPSQGAAFGNLVFAKYCPSLYIRMSRLRLTITRSSWKSVLGIRAVLRFRFRMIRRACVGRSSAMACRSALTYTRLIARGRVRRV